MNTVVPGQPYRLAQGGRIDRSRPLNFTFDGRTYTGFAGDTLASALIANGVHLVGRSIKYHRPRGILAAGVEEPNAIVQVGAGGRVEPNARATEVELYDGLRALSVNRWPSLAFDALAATSLLSGLLVAGFYYKTFMAPGHLWQRLYEPLIRKAAGLGRAPTLADPDRYDQMYAHCDVLVVGAGAAGLAAAGAAAATGARVILVDEQPEPGGFLLDSGASVDGLPAAEWADAAAAQLAAMPEVTVLARTTAFGYYDDNFVCALERRSDHGEGGPHAARQRLWQIRAREVVLATGAHERPLVFTDNDRPGIMLAGAVLTYVRRYGALPGRRAVVFTTNDSAYETALALSDAGAEVAAVVDAREHPDADLPVAARARGIEVLAGHVVVAARGTKRVRSVSVARLGADGQLNGDKRDITCDLMAVSGGWSPAVHLFGQSQGKLAFDEARAGFGPAAPGRAQECAGALAGCTGLAESLRSGAAAGADAASRAGFGPAEAPAAPEIEEPRHGPIRALWQVPAWPAARAKQFVDFQNDTTAADLRLAVREGFASIEHVKRYTLTGFGTDQGKTANINALGIVAEASARPIAEVGTTTFRPPYTPVTFGALAGRDIGALSDPARITPMHDWHVEKGAEFEDVGQWKRPWFYPRPGEDMRAALHRECLAARTGVGVLDASTLGKIDIQGRDAAEFLNRIYTNTWTTLAVGRIRYGFMCGEDGMVFDDGTTTRLAENRFLMTTTTGNAALVLEWLEEWLQTEWPELEVYCTSVTEQWATIAIAGPHVREVLAPLAPGLALDRERFPFMSVRDHEVAGVAARICRISFSGELSYEINVPWDHGLHVWRAVMAAGEAFAITPYGTETMHVLRAEKGFPIVGQDTDGTVTPLDLGMGWAVSKKKDFIGRRSLARPDTARAGRKQLVGLETEDPAQVLPEGAQLIAASNLETARALGRPVPMEGHVSSSYDSATLGRSIALALVKAGAERMGETLHASVSGRFVAATIRSPVFYDPDGARRDG